MQRGALLGVPNGSPFFSLKPGLLLSPPQWRFYVPVQWGEVSFPFYRLQFRWQDTIFFFNATFSLIFVALTGAII